VLFGKVDTETQGALAAAFELKSIPTLMIFRDGVLIFAQPGMLPAAALESLIAKAQALDMSLVRAELAKSEQSPSAAASL
jgi:thioredoxin 1